MKIVFRLKSVSFISILVGFVSLGIFLWLPKNLFSSKVEALVFNFGFYHLSFDPWTISTPVDQFLTPFFLWASCLVNQPEDVVSILQWVTILTGVFLVMDLSERVHWSFALGVSLLLSSSPLYLIFQTWIAFSDPITFFLVSLYLIVLLSNIRTNLKLIILSFILFLALTNHFFQVLVIIILLNFSYVIYFKDQIKYLVKVFLTALVLYSLFLLILLNTTTIVWNHTRISVFSQMWGTEFIRMNTSEPFLGTIGLFHGLWPIVIYLMIRKPILLLVFGFCYFITMLTYDTSRVFSILSTPILIFFSIEHWKVSSKIERRFWIFLTVLSPILCRLYPLFYKWDGKIIYLQ